MDKKLFVQAITKYLLGLLALTFLLFVPAGTLDYYNGQLLIGLLFGPMFVLGAILMIKNPELLRKRLNSKEKETEQKSIIIMGGIMFICGFITAGLDYRFQWSVFPRQIVIVSAIIFFLSYLFFWEVLRENTYLSRTIEVQKGQMVIDTGLYGIVRHPMYAVTIFLFLSMPLVLGSLFSFIIFLGYPFIVIRRIKNEEQVLEKDLEGYSEYKGRVKYKLIPFIW